MLPLRFAQGLGQFRATACFALPGSVLDCTGFCDYDMAMRIALTKYGLPQVVVYPAIVLVVMGLVLWAWLTVLNVCVAGFVELSLLVVLVWAFSFFRDPKRAVPQDKDILLAPADGKVTDIETVDEKQFIDGRALRIGIFMSIFDVHINRAPCSVRVEKITYKKGKFKNAMNPESGRVNESNDVYLLRAEPPGDKLIVRQISGAIARRIVCEAKVGAKLTCGQRFGMVKFGSRTELYIPLSEGVVCLVETGDKVKAGITPMVRYKSGRGSEKWPD